MKPRTICRRRQASIAIFMALAVPVSLKLAYAGAGWGNSTDALGGPIKTPTYYANSPSGVRASTDCFTAPPSTGAFDTLSLIAPSAGAAAICDTGTALRKFVDSLPGLNSVNNLGNSIPVAVPDTTSYPGSDYYEIGVVEYKQKMHSDLLNATTLRGYVQLSPNGTVALTNLDGTPVLLPDGTPAKALANPSYMGPLINSTSGTPTRIKFYNLLPAGVKGNLHIPVDETLTGAGIGPDGVTKYQQNRVDIHLHGGDTPWISDGTPHQWILPAADEIALSSSANPSIKAMARGVGAKNVPDMPDPGPGAMTYYFPNGQSGRMMFYHDHTIGLTRLNVYSGVAAGYMLNDKAGFGEKHPALAPLLPADTIPLVIQDKTFVPKDIALQDAKWKGLGQEGDLWFPHVYETNQDPNSVDGTNPVGRWDWGPWFWPVFPSTYGLPTGEVNMPNTITGLSEVSTTPEAFMDTPVVNGTAYPTLTVQPKSYRFRVLNAANDRFLNLGLYLAADKQTTNPLTPTSSAATVLCDGVSARPDNTVPVTSDCTEVKMVNFDSSYVPPAVPYTADGTVGFPATGGIAGTGWGTQVGGMFPQGAPDPATAGPHIVQIGNEAGLLVNPLDIPSTPINYEYNKRSVTVLNVQERGLYLGAAERADVLIDFSQYAGKTLILYNDAPAPVPASDPRIDYYTGNGDNTGVGGAPNTLPGYGPNTRTIMQIVVAPNPPQPGATLAQLQAALPQAYASIQPRPGVPEPEFSPAFAGMPALRTNAKITAGSVYLSKYQGLSFTTTDPLTYFPAPTCSTVANCATAVTNQKAIPVAPANTTLVPNGKGLVTAPAGIKVNAYIENKAIQELFDPTFGRMNATLGVELPFTTSLTQTTVPLSYIDPTTETVSDNETQFWKVTHNGVDTHTVHFHLVNVQVINRIGWDGTVKIPHGDEMGWKETVKMNPLEDIVVAVRAKKPVLTGVTNANAFGLPLSSRLRDPSQPAGTTLGFTQVDPATGLVSVVSNQVDNYGWEYVWHCHILGHEENDFMRPVKFDANEAPAAAPTGLTLAGNTLNWTDAATTEYAYKVERADINGAVVGPYTDLTASVLPAAQKLGVAPLANATTFVDTNANPVVVGNNAPVMGAPTATATSVALTWSSIAGATGYTIQRASGANQTTGFATIGTSATASFNDTTVAANTAYTYRVAVIINGYRYQVTAVGANGSGSATVDTVGATSAPVSVTTPGGVVSVPGAVNDLSLIVNSKTQVQLSWTDRTTGETGYLIQRCVGLVTTTCTPTSVSWVNVTSGITPTGPLVSLTNSAMTATLTAILPQKNTVNYRIYPMTGNVQGPVSNTVGANLLSNPVAPTNVTGTPGVGSVTLSWVDVATNNMEYRFRSRYALTFAANGTPLTWSPWVNVTVSPAIGGNATTATLTAAQIGWTYRPGRTFQFQVGAWNEQGANYTVSPNIVVQ